MLIQPPVAQPAGHLRFTAVPIPPRARAGARDALQGASQPLRHLLASQLETPVPLLRAIVREAQKVKNLRFALAALSPVAHRKPPELDKPRLVGMQDQFKAFEPRLHGIEELLRIPRLYWKPGTKSSDGAR